MSENTQRPDAVGPDDSEPTEVLPDRPTAGSTAGSTSETPRVPEPSTEPIARPDAAPVAAVPSGPRVGTVVWGLVVLAIGLGVLAIAAGARIDLALAAILLLGGAGLALVAGSIVSSLRRRGDA